LAKDNSGHCVCTAVVSVVAFSIKSTQVPDNLLIDPPAPRSFRIIATMVQDACIEVFSITHLYGLHVKKQWAFWVMTFGWTLTLLSTFYALVREILTGSWKDAAITSTDLVVIFVLTWIFFFNSSVRRFFGVKWSFRHS
jgi:hypothetical protein